MQCWGCEHFTSGKPPHAHAGTCSLRLPPWLEKITDGAGNDIFADRAVRADAGCDLGKLVPLDWTKEDYETIYGWGGQG